MVEIEAWLMADEGYEIGPLEPAEYKSEVIGPMVRLHVIFETPISRTGTFSRARVLFGETWRRHDFGRYTVVNGDTMSFDLTLDIPLHA